MISRLYFGNTSAPTPAPVILVDTHDGFDGKHHGEKRRRKERLHNQVEQAFRDAFEAKPQMVPMPAVQARNDEPLMEFVFPAYREVVEDDEDEELLLMTP